MRVVVAGASGLLGKAISQELARRGHEAVALSRRRVNASAWIGVDLMTVDPASLAGELQGIDAVISTVGAPLSLELGAWAGFDRVDVRCNLTLLRAAEGAGVSRFGYVVPAVGQALESTTYVAAHRRVENALRASPLNASIIAITGLYGTLAELASASPLRVLPNIGGGRTSTNPIDERDAASICVNALERGENHVEAGGPDIFTRHDLFRALVSAAGMPLRLVSLPTWLVALGSSALRPFHPRFAQMGEFFAALAQHDSVSPTRGRRRLADYFTEEVAA